MMVELSARYSVNGSMKWLPFLVTHVYDDGNMISAA